MTAVEELARELRGFRRRLGAIERGENLAFSSFEGGAIQQYNLIPPADPADPDGEITAQLAASFGQQYDGTNGVIPLTGPVPPAPAALTLTPVPGGVLAKWEGDYALSQLEVAPLGFTHVEVHVSTQPVSGILFATKRGEIVSARGGEVFVPVGGGVEVYGWGVTRTSAGKASIPGPVAGPVAGGKVTEADLDVDLSQLGGGTTIWYDDVDPTTDPGNTVRGGDLWLKEPENVGYRFVIDDLGAGTWVPVRDSGVTTALQEAAAAKAAAATKSRTFTQPDAPADMTADDVNDLWVDTTLGVIKTWDGAEWQPYLIGNDAFAPNSLVASDLFATGTVSGDLIEGTAIDGMTITGATFQTEQPGAGVSRVVINSVDGFVGQGADGSTKTQVGTDGLLRAIDAILSGTLSTGGGTAQGVRISKTAGQAGGGAIELWPNDLNLPGGTDLPGVLEAASEEGGIITALKSPPRVTDGRSSHLILRSADTGVGEGIVLDSTADVILTAGGNQGKIRFLGAVAQHIRATSRQAGLAGNLAVPADAELILKVHTVSLASNAFGDNTVVWPAPFPNGCLAVFAQEHTSSGNSVQPWGTTLNAVNIRFLNGAGGVLASTTLVMSVIGIGW